MAVRVSARFSVPLLIVILLAGCDPQLFSGAIEARVGLDGLEFRTCSDIKVREIYVERNIPGVAQSNKAVWVAEGEGHLAAEQPVLLGQSLPGMSTITWEPDVVNRDSRLAIVVTPDEAENVAVSGEFDIRTLERESGLWFDSRGEVVSIPCTASTEG